VELVVLLAGAFVGALLVLMVHVAYAEHRLYQLYARFARDWCAHADRYAQSALRIAQVQHDRHELLPETLELFRSHDKANLAFCTAEARYWSLRIPERLRKRYLGQAA
jgi:hypothetical protein